MTNIIIILTLLLVPFFGLIPFSVPEVLRGQIGISCVFLFTGVGHFLKGKEMSAMVPLRIPEKWRLPIICVSGVLEVAAAIAILANVWTKILGILLSAFLILVLPANIDSAIRRVPFGGHGIGPKYLLVRIPLQILLIGWIWWFVVLHQR